MKKQVADKEFAAEKDKIEEVYKLGIKIAQPWVQEEGRLRYIQPINQALVDSIKSNIALICLTKSKKFYHQIGSNKIKKVTDVKD